MNGLNYLIRQGRGRGAILIKFMDVTANLYIKMFTLRNV